MGGVLQQAAPVNGETVDHSPMGMWPEVACLLEDWGPPQDWRQVEVTPEAVGVALGIVSRSFENQSAGEAVGTMGLLLPTVLKAYRGDPRNGGMRTRAAKFCGFPEEGDVLDVGGGSMREPAPRCHWR